MAVLIAMNPPSKLYLKRLKMGVTLLRAEGETTQNAVHWTEFDDPICKQLDANSACSNYIPPTYK